MKSGYYCSLCILCLIFFFFLQSPIHASSDKILNEFKFFNIGVEDTKKTAADKLKANELQCGPGKATFLDVNLVLEKRRGLKTTKKIEKIIAMDKDFEYAGQGVNFDDMPIDVIACNFEENSPFSFSAYYFSNFDQKIMAVDVEIKNFEMIKENLISKFGPCIMKGYCESEDSILFLVQNGGWSLHAYFFENLKRHHKKIKRLKAVKDQKLKKQINQAF